MKFKDTRKVTIARVPNLTVGTFFRLPNESTLFIYVGVNEKDDEAYEGLQVDNPGSNAMRYFTEASTAVPVIVEEIHYQDVVV